MVYFSPSTAVLIGTTAALLLTDQASANVDELNFGLSDLYVFEPFVNFTTSDLAISFDDLYCGNLTANATTLRITRLGNSEYSKQVTAVGLNIACTTGNISIADSQGNSLTNVGIEIESVDASVTTWLPIKDPDMFPPTSQPTVGKGFNITSVPTMVCIAS